MPDLNLIDEGELEESPAPAAAPPVKKKKVQSSGGGGKIVIVLLLILIIGGGAFYVLNHRGLINLQYRQDVFLHGELAEDRRLLGKVADAEVARPQVHRQPRDVGLVHAHAPALGRHQSHDHVETGCLAGAVGAQQSHYLAAGDFQVDVPDDLPSLVALADSLGNQCFHSGSLLPLYFLCARGAVVSVVVSRPPPSILTLSSRLWKIKASPLTLPCSGSVIFGGVEAVPVST